MGTIYHDILEKGDRHALHDLGYTNQANRKAGAGISSIHLNRIVEQEDDRSFWIIKQVSPSIIMDPFVPPAPALGDIGKVLTVASDADSYVKFSWAAPTSADIFDDIYNNESGTHTIYVDDGDMFWQLAGTNSFELDLVGVTGTADGFMVSNGADQFDLIYKGAGLLDLDADLRACDISANLVLALSGTSGASIVAAGGTSDLTFGARSASINLNESGDTTLDTTKQTLVGAINEINALVGGSTFDDIYNNESGTHSITMDDGDVSWNCNTTNDFVIDVTSSGAPSVNGRTVPQGFSVENGADYFKIGFLATDQIMVDALIGAIDIDASATIKIDSASTIEWSGTNASLSSAGALSIDSDLEVGAAASDGTIKIYDADNLEYLNLTCSSSIGRITTAGTAPSYIAFGSGTTSHGLNANGDVLVSGKLEVDGASYFDSTAAFASSVDILGALGFNARKCSITSDGTAGGSIGFGVKYIGTNTANMFLGPDHTVVICSHADQDTDFNRGTMTDPTVFIHSSDETDLTQWISFAHNQTNGVIETGAGALVLNSASGDVRIPSLNTGDNILTTDTDGDVQESGAKIETGVSGGSILNLQPFSSAPSTASLDAGDCFVVDTGSARTWNYYDGTSIYSVEMT